jgi:tetratricopeptide (TPR) repeat protein
MPQKKKSVAVKSNTNRRMTEPQPSKTPHEPEPARKVVTRAAEGAAPGVASGPKQLASFDAAIKLFHKRNFKEARDHFVEASGGPERDVAQRARLHVAMCDRRLQQATVELRSAEDNYNYGVALINSRKMAEARAHLEKALAIAPGSDHIHYALAVAQAISGDFASAHENLRRAIELEPRNRAIARQDADFGPLASQPPFHALLYPEKKSW